MSRTSLVPAGSSCGWPHALLLLLLLLTRSLPGFAANFEVPGEEEPLTRLEELFRIHRVAGPDTTLWDPWLPMSVLWFDTTNSPSTEALRQIYRERLLHRRFDADGYVSTQQHEGLAHSEGWPFPLWTQARGVGWHFTVQGIPYGPESGVRPTTTVTNWSMAGAHTVRLDPASGWTVACDEAHPELTSPTFSVDTVVAPFVRLKLSARGFGPETFATLSWQREGEADFAPENRLEFTPPAPGEALVDLNLPVYRHPRWTGKITRLRLRLHRVRSGSELTLARVFTAIDSRHNINNAVYLQACDDYLRWTGDLDFLRQNLQRLRLALAWAIREFQLAEKEVVVTPWIGHDGRSGHVVTANGQRTLRPGVGVGNNYWDLLPFGGEDALATIYYFDALRRFASLERQIQRHPEWNVPGGPLQFEPAELLSLAEDLQTKGNERFWNEETGRFGGWRDAEGKLYDYGFTFVNNEAIYYGFASEAHAHSIREWIDGHRVVAGDTATGADIYHWRFGPRATTRRNLETYFWGWSDPGAIPWGGQVQDGGAVLGFSFHDTMARLQTSGPEVAWAGLRETAAWFGEVQRAGGYRAYYADKSRGTLQGGGTAGGLGLDHEFFESALVPQSLLYGFLGFRPRLDGCLLSPKLPANWPSLTLRNIRLHDLSLDVTATPGKVRAVVRGRPARPLFAYVPGDESRRVALQEGTVEIVVP